MLCKKCGAEIADDAVKCEFCGNSVDKTNIDEVYENNEKNRRQQINKMMEDKQEQLSKIQERRDSKRARQRRNKILLIVALCVLGVGLAGIGVYYVNENAVTSALPTPTPLTRATPTVTPAVSSTPFPTAEAVTPAPTAESWTATGGETTADNGGGQAGASNTVSSGTASTESSASRNNITGSTNGASQKGLVSSNTAAVPEAKTSGISTNTITSQIAIGAEVVNTDGKWYMTFVSGDVKYYANVNSGATTDQVKGKKYTLTAVPTDVTYNGNTVYEITSMAKYDGNGYILPESGTRLLTKADISGLSKDKLAYARNEIYARHGRKFKTAIYQQYFESKSWYSENPNYNYDDDNSNLNSIEIQNVKLIIDAER